MSSVIISGDTSGAITVSAPAVAGTFTQTLPQITGTLGTLNSGTAVASTSGTSIDFTSLPANIRRITVMFNGVSVSASQFLIQLGTSSGVTTTGYAGNGVRFTSSTLVAAPITTGAYFVNNTATTYSGAIVFTNITGNAWTWMGELSTPSSVETFGLTAGGVTLSSILTRVRITTASGTDTYTAGTINILYE
jgi:hypothetical protein